LRLDRFMVDCKHPNAQGHAFLAQLVLARLVDAASVSQCEGSASTRLRRPLLHKPVRASYNPNGWCARDEQLTRLVRESKGFNYTDEGRGKPGLVAHEAGAFVTFCIDASVPGGAAVFLGYLESYAEQMGSASIRCSGRCECGTAPDVESFAPTKRVSITTIESIEVNILAGRAEPGRECCELTVRVLARAPGSTRRGHKFKVTSLILARGYKRAPTANQS